MLSLLGVIPGPRSFFLPVSLIEAATKLIFGVLMMPPLQDLDPNV